MAGATGGPYHAIMALKAVGKLAEWKSVPWPYALADGNVSKNWAYMFLYGGWKVCLMSAYTHARTHTHMYTHIMHTSTLSMLKLICSPFSIRFTAVYTGRQLQWKTLKISWQVSPVIINAWPEIAGAEFQSVWRRKVLKDYLTWKRPLRSFCCCCVYPNMMPWWTEDSWLNKCCIAICVFVCLSVIAVLQCSRTGRLRYLSQSG